MYKKTYLSFRFITSRPLCQIKQGDAVACTSPVSLQILWNNVSQYFFHKIIEVLSSNLM